MILAILACNRESKNKAWKQNENVQKLLHNKLQQNFSDTKPFTFCSAFSLSLLDVAYLFVRIDDLLHSAHVFSTCVKI